MRELRSRRRRGCGGWSAASASWGLDDDTVPGNVNDHGEDMDTRSKDSSLKSEGARHAIVPHPYLTTAEAAAYLRWSKRTIREKVRTGVFRRGAHYFVPPGCQMRWKTEALVKWLESEGTNLFANVGDALRI
jgi:excisionase family DNA binding protein